MVAHAFFWERGRVAVGKIKQKCHVCYDVTKRPKDAGPAATCKSCQADFLNTNSEVQEFRTVVQHEAGGIKSDLIEIILTSNRLLFLADSDTSNSGAIIGAAGAAGGLIGGAIAGAVMGASNAVKEGSVRAGYVSIPRPEITSLDEKEVGLLKGKREITLSTTDGGTYVMTLSKKESEQFKGALN